MLKIGDRVKYRDLIGEVRSVMDEMVIVKLPDNKEYSLPYDAVTLDGVSVVAPTDMHLIMAALKPYLKNVGFLTDLAKTMSENGVNELHIKGGLIQAFSSKESLEERLARYKAEALIEAERKARADHEQDSSVRA